MGLSQTAAPGRTFGAILDSYANLVASGHADTDLSPAERTVVVSLLRAAVHPSVIVGDRMGPLVVYPPSDRSRDDVIANMRDGIGRMLAPRCALVVTPMQLGTLDYAQWDACVTRALDIIRNA